jgi:TonB family protein
LLIGTDCISEGQNLQDCDYLINYDIHWNPVRIIQRFGRIDRIGSINTSIQLVNYWPDISLDEYINLKERVESPVEGEQAVQEAPQMSIGDAGEIRFTPFTVAPAIKNRDEIIATMEAEYPPLLREAGIGGTAKVWLLLDAEGNTDRVMLVEGQTTGHEALDEAALRVARTFRFTSALNRGDAVPVWVALDITFSPPGGPE